MGREVARLRPRTKPIEEAVLSFDGARFHDCLGALHGNASLAASALRARAWLRLNRPEAALEALPDVPNLDSATHAEIAEVAILKAAASMRLAAFETAHDALAIAWVHVVSAGDVAIEGELEYYRALLAWLEGRYDAAAEHARAVDALALPTEAWRMPVSRYVVSLAATQARALELRAFDAGRTGKLPLQVRLLRRGLAALRREQHRDPFVEAGLLRNLAIVAREIGSIGDADAIEKRIATIDWTGDLAEQRYHIVRALGWCRALAGDHVGALRRFREAASLAVTPAWRLFAVVDRAYLAVELDQQIFAEDEIAHALELSNAIDWTKTGGEESAALLLLAQLVAKRDGDEAARLLERYRVACKYASSLAFAPLDPRVRASEAYARAQIALGRGETVAAAALLADAFALWDDIGSKWRAALAASDLDRLERSDRYGRYADREVRKLPLSWLARRRAVAAS